MKKFFPLLIPLALWACTYYPAESTKTIDHRPAIQIKGASSSAMLYVNGLYMGPADFDAPVLVEPGTHMVKVVEPSGATYNEKVFVSGSMTKTITVPGGGQ
jgi:hypothetical protein